MADELKFLRANVIAEPLVDRFCAWLHTVAPVQAAMNLAFLQLPLLESHPQSPGSPLAADLAPDAYGADAAGDRTAQVRRLAEGIRRDRAGILRFAAAVAEGQEILRLNPDGPDLGSLQAKLPGELGGLVELVHDIDGQAQMRFLEPLVYADPVYDESRQSVRISPRTGTRRPAPLTAPHLASPPGLELKIPLRHHGLQALFRTRVRPAALGRLREELELGDAQAGLLSRLLTDRPVLPEDRHIDGGGRIRYFGHGCLVLQTPEAAVMTDPFVGAAGSTADHFTLDDLPDFVDLVLISHGRHDRTALGTLLQLRGRIGAVVAPRSSRGNIADPSVGLMLKQLGFPVIEADDFDTVPFLGGRVTATPFLSGDGALDIRGRSTYWIELAGRRIFTGADSSGADPVLHRRIRDHLGAADLAFLAMEHDGATLGAHWQAPLTGPAAEQPGVTRAWSGPTAEQTAEATAELGAAEAYVYAAGEEGRPSRAGAAPPGGGTCPGARVEQFLTCCAGRGVRARQLAGRREWRW
ncbi:MBL fold metallo-hydrolase [Streptacidiphilus griseoplanus]|uniref:MBL fold metallo-hydrolase n=1 Tax=Peterkaempfera griseoplana TaxID=66896 RepID=UPI0007C64983|nr:MBL fold metallo-hydrolase [Peterkaempfera griseoplana]